jgi:hypothetical protein
MNHYSAIPEKMPVRDQPEAEGAIRRYTKWLLAQ